MTRQTPIPAGSAQSWFAHNPQDRGTKGPGSLLAPPEARPSAAKDVGPEYVFVAGFTEGTDYQFLETEGFGAGRWGKPVEQGDYVMRVFYGKDRVQFRMSRAALGNPGAVRISVKASGTRTDGTSDGLVDWVGEPRSFTPWIARG